MKITRELFFKELKAQMASKSNNEANLNFNAGRWNYYDIYKCTIDGAVYYFGGRAKHASTSIAAIRRLCN